MEQLTVDVIREQFLEAVQLCSQVVNNTDPIPAYQCLRLEVKDGNLLQIAGMSREITIVTTISARVTHEGEPVAVSAERLASQLDAMPENETVRLVTRGNVVELTASRHKAKINTLDWQLLPVAEFPNQTTLGTLTDGGEGIFRGFYAADDNGLLSAIRLDARAGRLVVSGTNRYRMATMTAEMDQNHNENSFSLSKGTASLITKLFKGKAVTVTCNDRYLGFKADTLQVICITLAAMPPDLTQVIPHDYATMITMPTKIFRKEVKACRSTCDANSFGRLAIKPEENVVHISSSEANAGQTFIEVEGLNGHGPALELGVNLKYLEDALSHVTGDAAVLAVPAGGSLLAVLPQFGNGEFHVIMPMVLR